MSRDTTILAGNFRETMERFPLSNEELKYIDALLERPEIDEEDAELLLQIMADHTSRVEKRLVPILRTYPHLTKSVYSFCAGLSDMETVSDLVLSAANESTQLMEFQLFWFGAILEKYLMHTSKTSTLIATLFEHKSATAVSKAKILEIPDTRFGLTELRSEYLNGESGWLAWSSAVGSRSLKPLSRNYRLKYFGKWSPLNHLIATILLKT